MSPVAAPWFESYADSIGSTPLVRLRRLAEGTGACVLAKIGSHNPASSVKSRLGSALIIDAERRGALGPGKEIVELTSGNTGIAPAFPVMVPPVPTPHGRHRRAQGHPVGPPSSLRTRPGAHKIQGIGSGFVPQLLDLSLDGVLSGISGGAAAAVALRLGQRLEHRDKTIVCVLPDSGERYLTTALFDGEQEKEVAS